MIMHLVPSSLTRLPEGEGVVDRTAPDTSHWRASALLAFNKDY